MKKSKKAISVLLSLLMVLSIFTSIPFQTMAATTQDTKVGASSAKESIVYKTNDEYIEVADFGNSDYVDLDSSKEIYYKIYIDYELFYGSTLQLKVKSLESGSINTSSISIGKPSSYGLNQYVPVDLSDYSGKIELSIWVVLGNGQKVYDDEPVKLNVYSKIASGTCGDNLTWQLFDNGTLDINGTGEMYDFNRFADEGADNAIPWKNYRQQIKSVVINEGVTSIGRQAFWGRNQFTESNLDDSLISVSLPMTLTKIGGSAFSGCVNLASITIPNNVQLIDNYAFYFCRSLANIKLSSSIKEIGVSAFESSGLKNIDLPNKSVTTIKFFAFSSCNNLESVVVEGDVILHEGYTFAHCEKLKNIIFKGGISEDTYSVSGRYFEDCPMLESATLPSQFTCRDKTYTIQSCNNFDGCDNLKLENISFNDDSKIVDGVLFSKDGKTLLWYPEDLSDSTYDIPDGVQTLAFESFKNQQYLSHINIPDSVNNLGGRVFYNCSNLNNVIIPNGVTTLYDFQKCASLKAIYIPGSVTTMYQNYKNSQETFENCADLLIYCDKDSYAESFSNQYSAYTAKEAVYCTFDANGGSVENNKRPVIPGDKYWKLPTSTRKDYTFNGWFTSKTGGTQVTKNTVVTNSASHTLYAHWTYNSTTTPISNCTISLATTSYTYDGTTKKPSVTVKEGSKTLTSGTDYTVSYSNNTNAGTATVTITGKGNYIGTASKTFTINAKSISSTTVTLGTTSYTYDGTAKKPSVTVKDGSKALTSGTDYTVSYSNNTNVGTATVTITGKGNYTGTASNTFTINAKSISSTTVTLGTTSYTYDGAAKKPSVTVKDGTKTLTGGTDYTVFYSNNTNVGTATVTITGKGNYSGTVSKTFKINAKSISSTTVALSTTSYTYDGTAKKPSVTVKDGTKTLTSGTDYTVSYSNNTNAGTATVTVTGKGNYTGTVSKNFTITNSKQEFTWGQDNWNFNNWSPDYFPNTTYRQQMSNKYLKELSDNLTNDEYQYVFKGVYTRFGYQKAMLDDVWGGSCYGMSATTFLSEKGILPYSQYKSGASKLNDLNIPKDDINVMSLINYYQMLQVKDSVQQQYYSAKKKSNKENIQNIISQLDNTGLVLVGFRQDNWAGHAILAYGYEYGSWTKNSVTYNGRILICDPNRSSNKYSNYEDCYIYFNTNKYNWVIPLYYNTGYKVSSTNGAYINMVCSDIDIINDGGYLSGNFYNKINDYVARLDAYQISDDRSISKVKANENGQYINYSSSPDDIEEAYSFISRGDSEGIIGYNLYDSNSSYKVTQDKPQEIQLAIRYDNCLLQGGSAAGNSVIFDKNGFIQADSESASFNMSMTFNEDYDTDWFTIQVTGSNTDIASLKKVRDGYILEADNLEDVNVSANNKEDSAFTSFSTAYDSVYIYEINPNTIGLKVDTDNNGTYETELSTKRIGDVNGDGVISVLDATELQKYLVGLASLSDEQLAVADTNGDKVISILDATQIQKYIVGLVPSLG